MVILVMPEPIPAYATFKGAASSAKKIAPNNMTPNALMILIALAFHLLILLPQLLPLENSAASVNEFLEERLLALFVQCHFT